MGIPFALEMPMAGFYPPGGGELKAAIPGNARPTAIQLPSRGSLRRIRGISAVANLPMSIAERQQAQAMKRLALLASKTEVDIQQESLPAHSKGTLLLLLAEFEQSQACFLAL
jgi:RNA 3'-terminal phosphate cyclase (ATP)